SGANGVSDPPATPRSAGSNQAPTFCRACRHFSQSLLRPKSTQSQKRTPEIGRDRAATPALAWSNIQDVERGWLGERSQDPATRPDAAREGPIECTRSPPVRMVSSQFSLGRLRRSRQTSATAGD